jgi:hypothetical protein
MLNKLTIDSSHCYEVFGYAIPIIWDIFCIGGSSISSATTLKIPLILHLEPG